MLRFDDRWVWDFWFADDGVDFHLFYLFAPKSLGDDRLRHRNAQIGHATSKDLRVWVDHGRALGPGNATDFDATSTATGSVVRGADGLWRMFYTGFHYFAEDPDVRNIESVGVAVSTDLYHWEKRPGPVTQADNRWYETLGSSTWHEEAWRDPWVFQEADGNGWHMLITARANSGADDDRGIIGHAWSRDLEQWQVREPCSQPGAGFGHLEVAQLIQVDGEDFLIFSCDTAHLAQWRREQGPGGIWWAPLSQDDTGYAVEDSQLLVDESVYSGRVVHDRDGTAMLLSFEATDDDGHFVGAITDPRPLCVTNDGTLTIRTSTDQLHKGE